MKRLLFFLTITFSVVLHSYAQDLPRFMTEEERLLVESGQYRPPVISSELTATRADNSIRTMAEWEELQAVAITWRQHPSILTEIVRHSVNEVKVIIFYQNNLQSIRNYLDDRGVDPDFNIDFVQQSTNTIWIRDYGANPVYINDVDTLALVDWIYNRPRPSDDLVPVKTASHLNVPLFSTTMAPHDLVHTGGNFMSDGLGTGFSSKLVLDENGPFSNFGQSDHDENDIDAIMLDYMGISVYPKMTNLPFDLIHHIDMHMKLLDEETLLVGQYPEGIADGPQIEANIQFLVSLFSTAHGKPFRVERMPMPPDQFGRYPHQNGYYRTYTNSLFVNKTILVPVYEEKYDTTALRIWREIMPGYEVVGIDCNAIIPSAGALHCITKEVGVNDPLWITHEQPGDATAGTDIRFTARVQHREGIESVQLWLKQPMDEGYVSHEVSFIDGNLYHFDVSLDIDEGKALYYFHAQSTDGKEITRPIVAPEGYFSLEIEGQSTGIDDLNFGLHIGEVFPNPADQIAYVDMELEEGMNLKLSLVDILGRAATEIFSGWKDQGSQRIFLPLVNFESGSYILMIENEEGARETRKIVIR